MTITFDKTRGQYRYSFQIDGIRYARRCYDETGGKVISKRKAQEIEADARIRAKKAGKLPRAGELTLGEVILALAQSWKLAPDWPNKSKYIREILAHFGARTPIAAIDGAAIQDYARQALEKPVRVWTGGNQHRLTDLDAERYLKPTARQRTAVSVNRSLQILRAAFKRAFETRDPLTHRRVIDAMPAIEDLPEAKRRPTPIPDSVLAELMTTLPQHVAEAVRATLYFGFRRTEVFGLQIRHVDLDAGGVRLDAAEVKNNTDAFIAGGPEAMAFMAHLVEQARARGTQYLITWQRPGQDWQPIHNCRGAWRRAMDEIEKKYGRKWRWHDLRAAYITYVAIHYGAVAAQRLARHSELATTQRYIDADDATIRAAAAQASSRPILNVVHGKK